MQLNKFEEFLVITIVVGQETAVHTTVPLAFVMLLDKAGHVLAHEIELSAL
jgi:hypothetical protein